MSPYEKLPSTPLHQRANACILILCQNKDLRDMLRTIRMFEDRFNRRYKYPYVFINDVPFSDEFQLRIRTAIASTAEFGIVEPGTWEIPTWINSTVMDFCRKKMEGEGIMYGGSVPYRHMCRWYSGWFHRHALVSKYEWYWRLEPGVSYYCDITYDPFVYMENNDKVYGFTVALLEIKETIPSLWPLTRYYAYERRIENSTLLGFLADENGEYNGCHFWSNFEIARVDLWANPQYEDYFNYLDQWGGFYYERWGDAPVHSIYVALTQPKSRLHYFHDIGYKHDDFLHCAEEGELEYVCQCPEDEVTFDFNVGSCLKRWLRYPADGIKWTFDEGIGFDERGRPIRTYRSPNGDVVRLDGDRGFVWEDEDPNAWVDGREGVDWVWDWEIAYDDKTGGTKGSE
ncbi:nucleotide-diphospho-sugar transferase [Cladochytrium replicatum]|nr:nucleotide-diphospho-sugar transferase [Cladochytrium replicatum]